MSEGTYGSEFGEFLSALKDRSGLSYGVLAKRLHMSTSTLHRYCNGDAVPTDYAPVERLARLCKATPEELVELHRRWVLADAVRGKKGAVAAGAASPGEAPASAGEAQTGAGPSGSDAAATGVDDADNTVPNAPDNTPGTSGTSGATGATDTTGTAATSAASAASVTSDASDASVGIVGSAHPSGPDRPSRPRRSRRTVVLAGVAVAVVLGAVALTVNLVPGGKKSDDGNGTTVGAAAPEKASGTPTEGSPSPSASKSATPSEKPSPSVSVSATPTRSSGGAAPDGKTDSGPLLTANTNPYTWEDQCSQHYLIDRSPTDVGPPPVEQDAPAWVGAYKAVSAGEQLLTVTVQGTGSDTVVLEGLQVRVVGRGMPLAWTDYAMGVGCGGGVPIRPFTVALDAARPTVVAGSGQPNFPFKVSQSDPEVFRITAQASAYDVSWYLELSWSSGSRKGTLVIDDHGKPFRTSGNNGRPAYDFPLGGEKWEVAPVNTSGDG